MKTERKKKKRGPASDVSIHHQICVQDFIDGVGLHTFIQSDIRIRFSTDKQISASVYRHAVTIFCTEPGSVQGKSCIDYWNSVG
jgi:hypothetical protein